MEYQVPQFIEVEDKVIGPLSLRQFIYLAGGAGFATVTFFYLPFLLWAILATPVVALAVALAFYKVNGKPFIEILEAGFSYYIGAKLFLWRKGEPKPAPPPIEAKTKESLTGRGGPRLTSDKLQELSWQLDIKRDETK